MNKFSENLKQLRKEAGMTQSELAKLVGVSARYISWLEAGNYPNMIVLGKLADVFDISVDVLCGRSEY